MCKRVTNGSCIYQSLRKCTRSFVHGFKSLLYKPSGARDGQAEEGIFLLINLLQKVQDTRDEVFHFSHDIPCIRLGDVVGLRSTTSQSATFS